MNDGNTKQPVMDALTAIARSAGRSVLPRDQIGAWYNDSNHDLAVFSYVRDFQSLWGLSGGGDGLAEIAKRLGESRQDNNELTLLIVWDGMPEGGGNTVAVDSYVTPYDWALVLSIVLYRQERENSSLHPPLRILILDVNAYQVGTSFIQRSFFAFHNVFPWVQDYRPVAVGVDDWADEALKNLKDRVEYALLRQAVSPNRSDICRLIEDLVTSDCVLTTFNDFDDVVQRGKDLETLIQAWQKEFMKAGTRHSVANLVGPLIMADGFAEPVRSTARNVVTKDNEGRLALIEVLRALQMMVKPQDSGVSIDDPITPSKPFQHGKLRILLIDDQHKEGFQHIVGFVLFGGEYDPAKCRANKFSYRSVTLRGEDSAKSILEALEGKGKIEDWDWPRKLPVEADILLLDLRLWLDTETDKRKSFFGRLNGICDELAVSTLVERDYAFGKALQAGRKIKESGDGDEITALALFPLLLSYYDPAFPVVIFSSTHQRQLVEMLAHRKNIITDFSKPLNTGYGQGVAAFTAIQDLRQAIERSVQLYEARTVWKYLAELTSEKIVMPFIPKPHGTVMVAESKISNSDLIKKLAGIYEDYILSQRFYDFLSVPWEFLEAILSPVSLNDQAKYTFDISEADPVGKLGFALKQCRHKKAHGNFLANELVKIDGWVPSLQDCAVLEFMFLINLLSPCENSDLPENLKNLDRKYQARLIQKYGKLKDARVDNLLVSNGALEVLNGGEYVFLALAAGVSKSGKSLSMRTLEVFRKVKEELFSKVQV